jgi:hypothetical protein
MINHRIIFVKTIPGKYVNVSRINPKSALQGSSALMAEAVETCSRPETRYILKLQV